MYVLITSCPYRTDAYESSPRRNLESSPRRTAVERQSEVDTLVSDLLDRKRESASSPSRSRPSSYYGETQNQSQSRNGDVPRPAMVSMSTQTTVSDSVETVVREEVTAPAVQKPAPEYITYSKGVQTDPVTDIGVGTEDDFEEEGFRERRPSSRKQKEIDEEIRANLRREIEEELRATQEGSSAIPVSAQQRFPLRQLNDNELNAVTASTDFQSFVERSSKVIERALDEEYDLLADYTRTAAVDVDEDYTSKTSQSLRETLQLYSNEHSRRRMVTDLHFSPHFPELLLASYTKNSSAPNEPNGLVLVWNTHAPSRPEYVLHTTSDVLTARFSPFHPNLIIGGCYNGQVCIWDTRSSHRNGQPTLRTPPSGPSSHQGHTHPIFSLSVIGTPNAHNILTADTDGIVCSWSTDMLSQAQEYLYLSAPTFSSGNAGIKTDDLAPKCMSFPSADPTFFVVGSEEGTIYPCHRYDRAGAKAGVDVRIAFKGHTAPIMSTQYHPGRGPVDLGDLVLSSSSDWTVKLWRTKAAAAPGTATKVQNNGASATNGDSTSQAEAISPFLDVSLEDLVYDARWSPNKPSVFAAVTGAGDLQVFDLLSDIEVPVAKASPSKTKLAESVNVLPFKGLNKLAWEERQGKSLAVGGLDGVVTLFEVGRGLWCGTGEGDVREWQRMKGLVSRLETGGS